MTDIYLTKTPTGALVPADSQSAEYLQKQKVGQGFRASFVCVRNIRFHKKFFALLKYAFDCWQPEEKLYKGKPVAKNFNQFRADITILAGYYETAIRMDGTVRVTPKSIAFPNMDEDEFSELYSSVIDVLLQRIFIDQTREDVDNVVNNILAYT